MIAVLLLAAAATAPVGTTSDTLGPSVVSLVVSYQAWDDQRPWMKKNPGSRQGQAVVVAGPRLLTNAQLIADATLVQVEKFGRPSHVAARVAFVDFECNLALLDVEEPGFFDDLRPAVIAKTTPTEGALQTVRWRSQQFEAASSRVKRIQVEESWYGRLEHAFLHVQTDMTGGGWAEPVFLDGKLVGLTVSQERDQRARAIPAEIIAMFVERATDPSHYRGFPIFDVKWQVNEDRVLAAWLGQRDAPQGIFVRQIPWGSSGCGALEPLDILLSIDGVNIDPNGYVTHPRFGRVLFPEILVERHVAGDAVPIRVLRKKQVLDLTMTLRDHPVAVDLIPLRRGFDPPSYLVAGGLVFQELDGGYLRSWGDEWLKNAPSRLVTMYSMEQDAQRPERRRVVILAGVLPSEYNIGYQDLAELPVTAINGVPVDSLEDVDEAFHHPNGGFHTVVLAPNSARSEIVLDAATLEDATAAILETYGLPSRARLPVARPPDPGPPCPGMY